MICLGFTFLNAQSVSTKDLLNAAGDQSKFPKADYIVVYDSTKVDMQDSGLSYYHTHQLFKVLSPIGGKQLHTIRFGYDPMSAYAEIQKVIVYKATGEIKTFDLDDEINYVAPGGTILWGASEKLIDLGRLNPGDGVEVFLFKKGYTYALLQDDAEDKYIPPMRGHFYDIIPFWVSQPTKTKYYEVAIPKDKSAQYELYNSWGLLQSSENKQGEKNIYSFWGNNLLPMNAEPNMVALSDVAPKVLLSTAPDWFSKSKWFYNVNEDYGSFESTPEIDQKVKEILKDATDEKDSVSRLTHWVADEIRYFGLNMGPGEGYTLHTGDMTFTDRCGVCKDKAGLLVTMLRSAGFEAYAAMTMAGSRIDYIPADQFNHSVAAVKLSDGKMHMLDPTWVPFVRELWSSAEQQQNYIIGLPDGQDLQETPLSAPENHYMKVTIKSTLQANGDLDCNLQLSAEGQTDAAFRRLFTGSDKKFWRQNLNNLILNQFPSAVIKKSSYSPQNIVQVLDGAIKLEFEFMIPAYAIVGQNDLIIKPLAFAQIFKSQQAQLSIDTKPETRQYPFRESCSRLIEINETMTVSLPVTISYYPAAGEVNGSGASWKQQVKLEGNTLTLSQTARFNKRIYQPEDWPSFREAVMAQKFVSSQPMILKLK